MNIPLSTDELDTVDGASRSCPFGVKDRFLLSVTLIDSYNKPIFLEPEGVFQTVLSFKYLGSRINKMFQIVTGKNRTLLNSPSVGVPPLTPEKERLRGGGKKGYEEALNFIGKETVLYFTILKVNEFVDTDELALILKVLIWTLHRRPQRGMNGSCPFGVGDGGQVYFKIG